MTQNHDTGAGPLAGLKVLDLSRVLAGPLCTMLLGDMGAEVIKVEPPGGDDTRAWGPPETGGEAAYFLGINRNKRSVRLDLSKPAGKVVLGELIQQADVLVENYKVGTLARWGFDDAWLETNAPSLIRCSITGYGTTGPKAALPGYDFILQAESGLMSITGPEGAGPTKFGVAIVDITTGHHAVMGILAALRARDRDGRGQAVNVSLYETSIAMLANVAANHLVSGREAGRFGNGHPNIVPYQTFATADGELALAVGNDQQFAKLAVILGSEHWLEDPRFVRNKDRVSNRAAVVDAVAAKTKDWTTADLIAVLKREQIPCGSVNSVSAALSDPQTIARDMVIEMEHPTAGSIRVLGFPIGLTATPMSARRPPPLLGEHTREVLSEVLDYDDARIEGLIAEGVV